MILTETGTIPDSALPVDLLKDHLQMGTVYADETLQDDLLRVMLRAAIAGIEARTGLALISRGFEWELTVWSRPDRTILPVRPVIGITALRMVDAAGAEDTLDTSLYRLQRDSQVPAIMATGACLPTIPSQGSAVVAFDAGFGSAWDQVPSDLSLAVLITAAQSYENRHGEGAIATPARVLDLIEPYRRMRVGGGI